MAIYLMLIQGLLACLLLGNAAAELKQSFDIDQSTMLLAELQRQLLSNSVYLLHDSMGDSEKDLNTISLLIRIKKRLMNNYITVSSAPFSELDFSLHGNNSLQVLLTSDSVAQDFLRKAPDANIPLQRFTWILFLAVISLEEFFEDIYIPLNCRFLVVQPSGNEMTISSAYRHSHASPLVVHNFGNWSSVNWTAISYSDLQGATVKVTTLDYPPMMVFNDSTDSPVVGGYFGQVWKVLESRMKFNSVYIKPMDNEWGLLENGTWNGMVSLLLNGSADVAVVAFSMTNVRLNTIDFSTSVINNRYCVHVAIHKDRKAYNGKEYLEPFSNELWIAVLVCIISLAFYMSLLYHIGLRIASADKEPQCENLVVSLFCVFGIFCQKGHEITPTRMSCRIVYFTAYVTAVILFIAYSSQFVAYLTAMDTSLPFTNFQEMLDQGDYVLGMSSKSGVLDVFNNATDPLLKKVYEKFIASQINNRPGNLSEVIHRLCHTKFAYMRSMILGMGPTSFENCSIVAIPQASVPETLSMAFPKSSRYREIINQHLQDLRELGILKRISLNIWWNEMNVEKDSLAGVGLENVLPLLMLLMFGVAISIIQLFIERKVYKVLKNTQGFTRRPHIVHVQPKLDVSN